MARTNLTLKKCRQPPDIYNKLLEHDASLDALMGDAITSVTSVTETATSGALSVTIPHSELNVSGTKSFTLAAGTKTGQRKSIRVTTAGSTPNWTVTATLASQGAAKTSVSNSSGAVNDGVDLIWDGASWVIVHTFGSVTTT